MNKSSMPTGFVFFAALLALLLVTGSVTYETWLEHKAMIVRQMETEAARIDRALIIEVEHSSHILLGIGQEMTHMDTSNLNSIAILLRSFDTTATVHHVFSWIDAKDNNVVSSNKGVHPAIDVSDRDFLKKSKANPGRIEIGDPIHGRVSGLWALPVGLGLTDATGQYTGTVLISMDIHTITADLQRVVKDSGIYFAIYSPNLLPLTHSISEETPIKFTDYNNKLQSLDMQKHPSGLVAFSSPFDPQSAYVYYEKSATYPYVIVLGFDRNAEMAMLNSLLVPRLLEILALSALMLGVMWLIRSRIVQPITELAVITNEIAHGSPFREPATTSGIGEMQALTRQIRKLSDYLHEIRIIQEEQRTKNIMLRNGKLAADLSKKIKTDFMASMSHDLRIPLNTIVGFAEIMKNQNYGKFDSAQYAQYAQDIYDAARQMQYLINDIKKLSSAEAAMAQLQEKPVEIKMMLGKALRLVGKVVAERRLAIEIKVPDNLPLILMDEHRFEQIIVNIALNIAGNSPPGSNIIIRAYHEKDYNNNDSLCISFDSIPGAVKSEAESGRRSGKPNVGHLGIPLTKALAAMHEVQLEIKNSIGKPASITLRFPKERIVGTPA